MPDIDGNVVYTKSFKFAIRIVNLYKYLLENKKENILSKQVLRSGTSIGANIGESTEAQTKKDFITKLYISLKESAETKYWLKLLIETGYLDNKIGNSLLYDLDEITKLLNASIKTAKKNMQYKD